MYFGFYFVYSKCALSPPPRLLSAIIPVFLGLVPTLLGRTHITRPPLTRRSWYHPLVYINSLLATLNARAGTIRTALEGPRHRHGQLRVEGSGVLTSINFKSGQEGLGVGETQVRDILCITAIYEVEYEPVIGYSSPLSLSSLRGRKWSHPIGRRR